MNQILVTLAGNPFTNIQNAATQLTGTLRIIGVVFAVLSFTIAGILRMAGNQQAKQWSNMFLFGGALGIIIIVLSQNIADWLQAMIGG